MEERRRLIRLILEPPIEVKVRIIPSRTTILAMHETNAFIRNISVGGGLLINFAIKSEAQIDGLLAGKEKLYFERGIPGIRPQVKILGKVAWLRKMEKRDYLYEAGVAFENLDERTKEDILHAMIDLAFKQKFYR